MFQEQGQDIHCNFYSVDHIGKGHPIFDKEYECTYFFHWETNYACLNHPIDAECHVNWNGRRFDLSPLVRHSGKYMVLFLSQLK